MATKKRTVSVRLDPAAERRLEQAAQLMQQSRGAFLRRAGDATARQVLLEWAIVRYRQGAASLSELADQTGLAVEEIVAALGDHGREEALAQFLASCRTVAETQHNPAFLRLAQEAVESLTTSTTGAS